MTDDSREDHDARTTRGLADLTRRQRQAVEMLVVGDPRWATEPSFIVDALVEVLQLTLEFIVLRDGTQTPWAIDVVESIRARVLAAANTAAVMRH